MVAQSEASALKDNQLLKNLAKLEIPENFPIGLTALSSDTIEFCKLEHLQTLGEFCIFAQGMSQNVIVGGDFRKLLNALSHIDEASLARMGKEFGRWPWPRDTLASVLTHIERQQPAAIVWDIVFSDADRLSPGGDAAFNAAAARSRHSLRRRLHSRRFPLTGATPAPWC